MTSFFRSAFSSSRHGAASLLSFRVLLFAGIGAAFIARCGIFTPYEAPPLPPPASPLHGGNMQLLYSHCAMDGVQRPLVVRMRTESGETDRNATGYFAARWSGSAVSTGLVKKGVGCALVSGEGNGEITISDEFGRPLFKDSAIAVACDTIRLSQSLLNTLDTIGPNMIVLAESDLVISRANGLIVKPNVTFLLSEKVSLVAQSPLSCEGTDSAPVFFTARDRGRPWGGVVVKRAGNFRYTFFSGGGGNSAGPYVIGHSKSQAAVHVAGAEAVLHNCFFAFNAGKGVTAQNSRVSIDSCLFTFCDMGGEFEKSLVSVSAAHVMYIPDSSGGLVDDDNDGFYFLDFYGAGADSQYSVVKGCVFFHGKDDAIDHNGAFLSVSDCWIEDMAHEGFAGSNRNTATLYNCYITRCGQGVEAGYGTPKVEVDHCLITANTTGVRFGDFYDWGCSGSLRVTNSIIYNNEIDIRNYDLKTNAAVDSALYISYSIVDTPHIDFGDNNIFGTPQLTGNLLLESGVQGTGEGSDNLSIGLVSGL